MVTAQFYDNEKQKEAIMFCFDKIAEALPKPVQVMQNYIPELSNEWPNWAIDEDGCAYFYQEKYPERGSSGWRSDEFYHMDDNFDADKYPHMWQNGAWRNSLKCK